MNRELLQQALDALKNTATRSASEQYATEQKVIRDIEAELAKPEQEPVAYRHLHEDGYEYYDAPTGIDCNKCEPLYTSPFCKKLTKPEQAPKLTDAGADANISRGLEPKGSGMVTLNQVGMRVDLKDAPPRKPWVGLSDEEIDKCDRNSIAGADSLFGRRFYKAIEAKLREKNDAHT